MRMSDHYIELTISFRSGVSETFVCRATKGAKCREECAEACGAWEDGEGCDCRKQDSGECTILPWLENDEEGFAECYVGPRHELGNGSVEFEWQGDWYGWRYKEEFDA